MGQIGYDRVSAILQFVSSTLYVPYFTLWDYTHWDWVGYLGTSITISYYW